jgi:hypothetical protein
MNFDSRIWNLEREVRPDDILPPNIQRKYRIITCEDEELLPEVLNQAIQNLATDIKITFDKAKELMETRIKPHFIINLDMENI